ncbi:hypothetical protein GBAR_LOCUS29006 [Geodia barretti]|nr:hypothetical protein GBAR_LOCUS29006 [Geodia barretti]
MKQSTNQAVLVGGVLGSLIVLVLIAIFVALIIKLVWKRRGHTQPVEGRRFHNRDMINTTYTHREPSPYECPARQPQDHDYAELEREHPHDSSQHQDLVHLYEEADKYLRGVNDESHANVGYQLTGKEINGKRLQFQCIITPPPEDDYANPDDAVTSIIQESTGSQTVMAEQHNYAVLEQDIATLEG